MWRKMFETYAIGPIPSDDDIREAVIADRPRFEAKLAAGAADLPENRFTTITYESLIANPAEVIEQLYERLELGDFDPVREAIIAETKRRSGYQAKGSLPSDLWRQRISNEWAAILTQHKTTQYVAKKNRRLLRIIAAPVVELGGARLPVAGGTLDIFQRSSVLRRRGNDGGARRVR